MKVVFVNRYFFPDHSATSQILSDLAFFLAERGWEVHVVTSRQRYDDAGAGLSPHEIVQHVRVHRVWTLGFGRRWLPGRAVDYLSFYLAAARRLVALLSAGDIVVAKTDPPLISVVASVAARMRRARLVNWWQDVFPETAAALGIAGTQGWPGRLLALLRDSSLRAAAANVAIGEKMRDFLVACGADADTIRTIHNWCDDEVISPFAPEDNALRWKWGLAGKFVVGYSGNLGRAHEFETILDAARRLEKHVEVVFLFIGGGHQWERVKNNVALRRIANVLFEPYQPRAALRLSLTVPDVHLVSLRPELEGLIVPSKFYGIAAAGRPTVFIGAESGEIANLLARGKCGAVVGPGNGEGLAKVLLEWMMNPDFRIRMGNNARLLLDGEYRKASALVRWEALLKKL